jgi:succinate dehydrogenase hydrophobic anchor subunit
MERGPLPLAPGSRHRARLGQKGTQHWFAERLTAVALVPLSLWFVASIIAHAGTDYEPLSAGCSRRVS